MERDVSEDIREILRIVGWFEKGHPRADREELEGAAMLGYWQAVRAYDDGEVPFWKFAIRRIIGSMTDYCRGQDFLTRDQRASCVEAEDGTFRWAEDAPYVVALPSQPLSIQRFIEDADDVDYAFAGSAIDPGYARVEDSDLSDRLMEFVAQLPERERLIVTLCDVDGLPQSRVAEYLGVSIARVSQLRSRALSRLRAWVATDTALVAA